MSCVITTTAKAAVVISEMPMNRLARLAYSGHRDAQAAYDEMEGNYIFDSPIIPG